MSRIHEALKRAEQERSASHDVPSQSAIGLVPAPESETFSSAGSTVSAEPSISPGREIPSLTSPVSLDKLLSRCPQAEWKPDASTMLFMNENDSAPGTEQYRTLRSRLYHEREKLELKTLLVASALPREGKSFTAVNLAQAIVRQPGRSVLLIDADLRSPSLHRMLGTVAGPGLADFLQGTNDEFSIMQRGQMKNLFFIPSGNSIEDPAELVGNGRLKILLQRVEPLFDWVIIDSPPAVLVSDASVLAKECDGVLLVVRSNSTPSDLARRARSEFSEQVLVGVVLNGTGSEPAYARHYYEAHKKNGTRTKT
jgi:capsular exopolysaccharide synthesis family protein